MQLLLATGQAEPDSKDNYGRTPLSWAAEHGHQGGSATLAGDWPGRARLEGHETWSDAAVVCRRSWARGGGTAAAVD